ncbi:tetratricopeptide repeat protein [Alicyclobacillus macrosporangiidus]|uniref:tetratricopeptide repeat protein n=1 Tax=Alicyclobacillus macrosporangiidus TaxID=392015 RepID=UPI0005568FD1|nr:tetratricopeptide repeat protein [Alicyclobacillus macrosporangiidus]
MIGTRIRELRRLKKLTQEEVCRGICDRSLLSKIENGATVPSVSLLEQLSKRLGVELSFLVPEWETDSEGPSIIEFMKSLLSDNNHDSLITYGMSAIQLKVIKNNENLLSKCLHLIGLAYHAKGKYREAKNYFSMAVDKSRNTNLSTYVSCLNSLAASLINLGQYEEALMHLQAIAETSVTVPVDARTRIKVLFNRAKIQKIFGDTESARRYLREALYVSKREGILESAGHVETLLGLIYLEEGHLEQAIQCFERSRLIYTYISDVDGQIGSYVNLAEATLKKGDRKGALRYATMAKSVWLSNHLNP